MNRFHSETVRQAVYRCDNCLCANTRRVTVKGRAAVYCRWQKCHVPAGHNVCSMFVTGVSKHLAAPKFEGFHVIHVNNNPV